MIAHSVMVFLQNQLIKYKLNLFVSTTFFKDGTSLDEALSVCKNYNINNIELGSNHKFSENFEKIIKKYDFKYLMHNYFPIPKESFVLNLASLNDIIYERSLKHIKDAIDLCVKTNCKLYTVHPGFLTDPKGPNTTVNNYDFQWNDLNVNDSNYKKAFNRMLKSLDWSINYANKSGIKIAIETEGSLKKSSHLLMQKPDEYQNLFKFFSPGDLGINLNIGHLNLSRNFFNFKISDFIDLIKNHLIAMELSHNEGIEDDHLPLKDYEWYWDIILDSRFKNAFKILEFRNTDINTMLDNIKLFKNKYNAL